jgi:hypothetical protein
MPFKLADILTTAIASFPITLLKVSIIAVYFDVIY